MNTSAANGQPVWSLVVVKGREVGRAYGLGASALLLGNAVPEGAGIDLAEQECGGPRKMAGRQASIESSRGSLLIRDLDSPGGTFVNRRRILPGQAVSLADGDVIEMGAVQVKVRRGGAETKAKAEAPVAAATSRPQPARSAPAAFRFAMKAGPVCRTWDDFLTISAQRWADLREELTSGRLGDFLAAEGQGRLVPPPNGSPDERLDSWLRSLPTTRECRPELEVHPTRIDVRNTSPGGRVRRSVRVANIGYGLLEVRLESDPPGTPWLGFDRAKLAVTEGVEVPIDIQLPEREQDEPVGTIVVRGTGGEARVSVRVTRPRAQEVVESTGGEERSWSFPAEAVRARLRGVSRGRRLAVAAAGAAVLRVGLAMASWAAGQGATGPATLPGPAVALAVLGGLAGAWWAGRRGTPGDSLAGLVAGAIVGVGLAAVMVAVDQALGVTSAWVGVPLWAAMGALGALGSVVWAPPARGEER